MVTHLLSRFAFCLLVFSIPFVSGEAVASSSPPTELRARVIAVSDGDTVTVLDANRTQHRIRLAGIDAPEKAQAFGRVAKASLSRLAYQRDAVVLVTKFDRYGREVGKLIVDGRDLCLEQIRSGNAWLYADFQTELTRRDHEAYSEAMREAKRARRGLWSDPAPVPPWVFRRGTRSRRSIAGVSAEEEISASAGTIVGNRRSHIFHADGCPDRDKISVKNRVYFDSEAAAVAAGYRKARNCR